jgi:hypothetical protein
MRENDQKIVILASANRDALLCGVCVSVVHWFFSALWCGSKFHDHGHLPLHGGSPGGVESRNPNFAAACTASSLRGSAGCSEWASRIFPEGASTPTTITGWSTVKALSCSLHPEALRRILFIVPNLEPKFPLR